VKLAIDKGKEVAKLAVDLKVARLKCRFGVELSGMRLIGNSIRIRGNGWLGAYSDHLVQEKVLLTNEHREHR